MLDGDEAVLYVGKSVRVRTRLLSYFRAGPGEKSAEVIRGTRSIVWDYVPNEFQALVGELRLIKKLRPVYNVEHRRKPSYAFVKLTEGPAPRLLATSRVANDRAAYFGPFPRPSRLEETVRELAHVMGLRDCPDHTPIHFGDQLEIFPSGRAPRCLRADTGTCLAPCAGRCTEKEYRDRTRRVRRFLEGRSTEPIDRAEEKMRKAASRADFEYAALLRDRAERLTGLQQRLVAFRGRVQSLSFVYRVPGFRGNDRIYLVRSGLVLCALPHPKGRRERGRVAARIEEELGAAPPDPATLRPEQAAEILLVTRWFQRNPGELRRTWAPEDWLAKKKPG